MKEEVEKGNKKMALKMSEMKIEMFQTTESIKLEVQGNKKDIASMREDISEIKQSVKIGMDELKDELRAIRKSGWVATE